MAQNYQDAMVICKKMENPNIFMTYTCNPKWSEITHCLEFIEGQNVKDRLDIVARVFKIKLDELLHDLRHESHFGGVISVVYTIEFQKRGLPHAHILIFLDPKDKCPSPADIDGIDEETTIDEEGFPIYRRRNDGKIIVKNRITLDNRYVVPYNVDLLVKYQSHLNVEWCNRS